MIQHISNQHANTTTLISRFLFLELSCIIVISPGIASVVVFPLSFRQISVSAVGHFVSPISLGNTSLGPSPTYCSLISADVCTQHDHSRDVVFNSRVGYRKQSTGQGLHTAACDLCYLHSTFFFFIFFPLIFFWVSVFMGQRKENCSDAHRSATVRDRYSIPQSFLSFIFLSFFFSSCLY